MFEFEGSIEDLCMRCGREIARRGGLDFELVLLWIGNLDLDFLGSGVELLLPMYVGSSRVG